ncbi:serine hydrolase [Phycicoccus sp. CSK15P-2]|nr:serine hydrolase [Phycicoccus sp. CSK15P-2]
MATRSGVAGIMVRDNRNGRYFQWRPRRQQSHSTIKVLILMTTLKIQQDRRRGLTSHQKSLASAMIRRSDNSATNALLRWATPRRCRIVADQLGLRSTRFLGGTTFRSSTWWGALDDDEPRPRPAREPPHPRDVPLARTPGVRPAAHGLGHAVADVGSGSGSAERRARRAEERMGPALGRLPAQLRRVRVRPRSRLPDVHPVPQLQGLLLRADHGEPALPHRLRRPRPATALRSRSRPGAVRAPFPSVPTSTPDDGATPVAGGRAVARRAGVSR